MRIAAATIADDLVPILTPHVAKGVVIRILGFDSHYTCSKNGPDMKRAGPRVETGREWWLVLVLLGLAAFLTLFWSPVAGVALLLPFVLDAIF